MMALQGTSFSFLYSVLPFEIADDLEFATCVIIGINILSVIIWGMVSPLPYGKYRMEAKKDKGKESFWDTPVSAKTFWRYGCIGTLVTPVVMIAFTSSDRLTSFPNGLLVFLYILHFFNRVVVYPSTISDKSQPAPFHLFITFLTYFCVDAFLQVYNALHVVPPVVGGLLGPGSVGNMVLGTVIFLVGFYINITHDNILTNLKAKGDGYQIPKGGLFKYVSCANYLGEIIEWWGFYLVGGRGPQFLYAMLTTVALSMRSSHVHQWYHEKFQGKYPKGRKAILPYLF